MLPYILAAVGGYLIGDSMKGKQYARGGELKSDLSSIKKKYEKNEDKNAHSENVVLLAKHFGTKEDLAEAKEILAIHEKEGYLSSENGKKRQDLYLKLLGKARAEMDKEGIEFAKGGVAFNSEEFYRKKNKEWFEEFDTLLFESGVKNTMPSSAIQKKYGHLSPKDAAKQFINDYHPPRQY